MAKRITIKAPRITASGAGWHIEYSYGEYTAVVDGAGPIGNSTNPDEARGLVFDYFSERATPETAAQALLSRAA